MFGWLKSLFGSNSVQETVVPPPLPKVKKTVKKAAKPAAKKAALKAKAAKTAKAPKKEKVVTPSVADPAPKSKKGGRPKKTAAVEPVQTEQNLPNS